MYRKIPLLAFIVWLCAPIVNSHETLEKDSVSLAASSIRNATFMERSPNFTDLYLIQMPDKSRRILIYCNSESCYRPRSQTITV